MATGPVYGDVQSLNANTRYFRENATVRDNRGDKVASAARMDK